MVASSAAANFAPRGGVEMDNLTYKKDQSAWHKYGVSKAGNIFEAAEYARRFSQDNILSVSLDPGNLKTPLYQNAPRWQMPFINLILKDPVYGAYTELFAGFSPAVQLKDSGRFSKRDILFVPSGTANNWTSQTIRPNWQYQGRH